MKIRNICLLAALAALAGCGGADDGNEAAPANAAATDEVNAVAAATSDRSILDTLAASPQHSSFANAVKAAGLTETLSGPTAYTVFAPTDEAFAQLPGTTGNDLLAPEAKGRLVALLTSHIVPGTVTVQDLAKAIERGGGSAQMATVGGAQLRFTRAGDALVVSSGERQARILGAEQLQSNGVIHSIDTVLAPAG